MDAQSQRVTGESQIAPPSRYGRLCVALIRFRHPVQLLIFLDRSKFSPCSYRAIASPAGALRITCPMHAA